MNNNFIFQTDIFKQSVQELEATFTSATKTHEWVFHWSTVNQYDGDMFLIEFYEMDVLICFISRLLVIQDQVSGRVEQVRTNIL